MLSRHICPICSLIPCKCWTPGDTVINGTYRVPLLSDITKIRGGSDYPSGITSWQIMFTITGSDSLVTVYATCFDN